jgi:hypothetical protein
MAAPQVQGTAAVRANASATPALGDSPTGIVLGELLVAQVRVGTASPGTITNFNGWSNRPFFLPLFTGVRGI